MVIKQARFGMRFALAMLLLAVALSTTVAPLDKKRCLALTVIEGNASQLVHARSNGGTETLEGTLSQM